MRRQESTFPITAFCCTKGGGNNRQFYVQLFLGDHGRLLYVGNALPFPLSLIPSHFALFELYQASSIKAAFDLIATQGSTSLICAPSEFQEAFLARLKSLPKTLNLRVRLEATEFHDLLPNYGEDYFELSSYLGYDAPYVGYLYGRTLSPHLRELLNSITVQANQPS